METKEIKTTNARIEASRKAKYKAMIAMMILDPAKASELLLGIKLTPHERIFERQVFRGKNIDECGGRGTAKTFAGCAITSILMAVLLNGRDLHIGIFSGSGGRGSRTVFEEKLNAIVAETVFGQSPRGFLKKICRRTNMGKGKYYKEEKDGGYTMELGKTKIVSTSVTENTRGIRIKKVVVDEANTVDRDKVQKIIKPASYHQTDVHKSEEEYNEQNEDSKNRLFDTQVVNVGTPTYTYEVWTNRINELMKKYRDGIIEDNEEESNKFREYLEKNFFLHVNFLDSYKHSLSIKEMIVDLNSPDISEEEAKAEILALPITQSFDRFYSPQIMSNINFDLTEEDENKNVSGIEEAQESDNATYCIGVDCSYGGIKNLDKMAIILSKRFDGEDDIHFVNFWEFNTTDINAYSEAGELIKELVFEKFKTISSIIIDMRGGGDTLKRELYKTENSRFPEPIICEEEKDLVGRRLIHMFNASDSSNTTLNNYCRIKMGQRKLHFPAYVYLRSYKKGIYLEKSKLIEKVINQFKMVDTEPTKNGKRFFVPSGKHKDSYSATLYSIYKFMEWESEVKNQQKKETEALYFTFNW